MLNGVLSTLRLSRLNQRSSAQWLQDVTVHTLIKLVRHSLIWLKVSTMALLPFLRVPVADPASLSSAVERIDPWSLPASLAESACSTASLPRTLQTLQNNLPHSPIWQANSLCIGLSPNIAKTSGMTRTSSLNSQSHAQIPSTWAKLMLWMPVRGSEEQLTRVVQQFHPTSQEVRLHY